MLKIIHKGTRLPPESGEIVGPVNNILPSIFKGIKVFFNGIMVYSQNDYFNTLNYANNTLGLTRDVKNTVLFSQGYSKDTAGNYDTINSDDNTSFTRRQNLFRKAKSDGTYEYRKDYTKLNGRLFTPFPLKNGAVIWNTKISIELVLADEKFYMLAAQPQGSEYTIDYMFDIGNYFYIIFKINVLTVF